MEITPGYGPASTPDASPLGEARLRVLRALTDGVDRGEPGTVGHVAALVGAHPNGVRRHLEALVEQGLVATAAAGARHGRGRPSITYAATAVGRAAVAAATAPISTEYLGMAAAFAADVAERSETPADQARTIGRSWGRSLAAQRPATQPPKEQVVTLLDGLGFSPLRRPDGDVALRTCPLLEAARATPEVLCQVHLGLVQGVSAAYGGPADGGELVAFAEPGACLLRLP